MERSIRNAVLPAVLISVTGCYHRQLNDLLGLGENSRRVDQSGGKPERTIRHRLSYQKLHQLKFRFIWSALEGAALRAPPHSPADVCDVALISDSTSNGLASPVHGFRHLENIPCDFLRLLARRTAFYYAHSG